jgi:hypothetical protein
MSEESLGFHAHDGWYFRREADGRVRISIMDGPQADAQPIRGLVLDASSWASIVASVSGRGENGERHRAALAFHAAEPQPEHPGSSDCPSPGSHGNPFRYCACGWIEATPSP